MVDHDESCITYNRLRRTAPQVSNFDTHTNHLECPPRKWCWVLSKFITTSLSTLHFPGTAGGDGEENAGHALGENDVHEALTLIQGSV